MSATATFSQLPKELRDVIWSSAAANQFEQWHLTLSNKGLHESFFSIVDSLQKTPITPPFAERQRQAFIGYDNLPENVEKQPLLLYVHDSHDRAKMRLGVNELQTLINRLPMATVCSEARSHATKFCQTQAKTINLVYSIDPSDSSPATGHPDECRDEILKPLPVQPETVVVTNARRQADGPIGFNSAEHMRNVITRIFGDCVQHIVFNSWYEYWNGLEQIYWLHTAQSLKLCHAMYPVKVLDDEDQHQSQVLMPPDRVLYVDEGTPAHNWFHMEQVYRHLLKFHEIIDVFPLLQSIEQRLHTRCRDEVLVTRIKATNKDKTLGVNWDDVKINFRHDFVEADRPQLPGPLAFPVDFELAGSLVPPYSP